MRANKRLLQSLWALCLASGAIVGCGGGGGTAGNGGLGGSTPIQNATFQITWPTLSKTALVHGLTSARSVSVNFDKASTTGQDVVINVDRDPSKLGKYTSTYPVPGAVRSSVDSVAATFYAQAGEKGTVVGTAHAAVKPAGTSLNITNIVVDGAVHYITVVPATLGIYGGASQLTFSAIDADSNPVAVPSGSATWTLLTGGSILSLTADGTANPESGGTALVRVSVDGVDSAPGNVVVADDFKIKQHRPFEFRADWFWFSRSVLDVVGRHQQRSTVWSSCCSDGERHHEGLGFTMAS